MKKNVFRSILCLALLLAVMLGATWAVNRLTAPIVEAKAKALLGDAVLLYDAADPAASALTVSGGSVQKIFKDEGKGLYKLQLSSSQGYTGGPIDLTLEVGFDGTVMDLKLDGSADDRPLDPGYETAFSGFLTSFHGKDSALDGVDFVASVTYSSTAIRNAVSDGMNALAENGLITAGQKSARQLLTELIPSVYPAMLSDSGALAGEEVAGSGSITEGRMAPNAEGFLWFLNDGSADYLGVWTPDTGAKLYGTDGSEVDNAALLGEIDALSQSVVKQVLGDAVVIYDAADPTASELTVSAESVQKIYRDDSKQLYKLQLSTVKGYTGGAIDLTLDVGFDGSVIDLKMNASADDRPVADKYADAFDGFLTSFSGQDSALAGVDLVAEVTFSSSAIRDAVGEGMDALAENGLIVGAEKSAEQLMAELLPKAFPGLVNKAKVIQGEELAGSGRVTKGYAANNGSGFVWFVKDGDEDYLGVWTVVGGAKLYTPDGSEADDSELLSEIIALSEENREMLSTVKPRTLTKMLPEGAELVELSIPGAKGCVTAAYTAQTAEGTRYAFIARPYGYGDMPLDLFYVLNAEGEIVEFRAKELILESEYYTPKELDEAAYKAGFAGMSAESYTDPVMVTGATITCGAVDQAVQDVFEAFRLATEN